MEPLDEQVAKDGQIVAQDYQAVLEDMQNITYEMHRRVSQKVKERQETGQDVNYSLIITEALEEMERDQSDRHRREMNAVRRRTNRFFLKLTLQVSLFIALLGLIALIVIKFG
jgi:hypothetical protein